MGEASRIQFGLIIAYLLPGFIGLAGIASVIPPVGAWLMPVNQAQTGFGPAVYAVLAAMAIGMIASCVRWLLLDHLHRWTGVVPPVWDDRALDGNLAAFNYLVEAHYRYYQFYGNSLVSIVWLYGLNRSRGTIQLLGWETDFGVLILCVVLFAGSRDALAKYYKRTSRLIGVIAEKDLTGDEMTNGNHHDQEAGTNSQPQPLVKPQGKSEPATKPLHAEVKTEKPQK